MWGGAQGFVSVRRWPTLGNMTRRKPWGLDLPYGESVKRALPRLIQDDEAVFFWR